MFDSAGGGGVAGRAAGVAGPDLGDRSWAGPHLVRQTTTARRTVSPTSCHPADRLRGGRWASRRNRLKWAMGSSACWPFVKLVQPLLGVLGEITAGKAGDELSI